MTSALEKLAVWATGTREIPSTAHHAARRLLMDQIGVSAGGGNTLETLANGRPSATVWSTGQKVYAPDAALHNRFAGDDLELTAGPEIGAAGVAAAEIADATLGELYVALAVASEIESYVRGWIQRPVEEHGLHPPALFGALSAAAVAAKLLRLDAESFAGVLAAALALSPQSHYAAFSQGATAKWLYGAWSQRLGVQCALWGREGLTGAPTTLEGARGIAQAFFHEVADAPAFQPGTWAVTQVTFKPYPCSRACHPTLSALEALGVIERGSVARVEVWSYPFSVELEERSTKKTPIAAQMSISAMLREKLGPVPVVVRAEGSEGLPRLRKARVRLTMTDGSVRETASEAKWNASAPATDEELRSRFLSMTKDRRFPDPWDADDDVRVTELTAHG